MPDTAKLVIGVAGRMGSGKTDVARHLEREHGFQYLRYSLALADWFDADPNEKTRLQEVGWHVMSGERQRELNRRLIAKIDRNRDCVVDGLRHPIDYECLKHEFDSNFYLLFIDTPQNVRFERLRQRFEDPDQFLTADSHQVESHIGSLETMASAVISGECPVQEFHQNVRQQVERFRTQMPQSGRHGRR